jgi:hypothetical protein
MLGFAVIEVSLQFSHDLVQVMRRSGVALSGQDHEVIGIGDEARSF